MRIFALLESSRCETWSADLGFRLYAHSQGYGRTSSEAFSLSTTRGSIPEMANYSDGDEDEDPETPGHSERDGARYR